MAARFCERTLRLRPFRRCTPPSSPVATGGLPIVKPVDTWSWSDICSAEIPSKECLSKVTCNPLCFASATSHPSLPGMFQVYLPVGDFFCPTICFSTSPTYLSPFEARASGDVVSALFLRSRGPISLYASQILKPFSNIGSAGSK